MAQVVAIDANMLLVYVVGRRHAEYLGIKKHLKEYMPGDFTTLCQILERFDKILITPNVVTECNNLLPDSAEFDDARSFLKELLLQKQLVEERYIPSATTVMMRQFSFLGVADCAMLSLVSDDVVLLTADQKLAREAQMVNHGSINFNHYRNYL